MSSATTGSPKPLEELTDDELIRLLPATAEEKYSAEYHNLSDDKKKEVKYKREGYIREPFKSVFNVLWLRYEANMRRALRGKVFECGSTLCPPQEPSKEDFVDSVLTNAYQAFLARTFCGQYENFPGYMWEIVFSTALDERKHLKGRFADKDKHKPIPVPRPADMPDPPEEPLNINSLDVRRIMTEYAEKSQENSLSANAVYKKWVEEHTWEELANDHLPPEVDNRSVGARTISIRRFVEKDEEKLRPRLAPLLEKKK
jgi:hypothetical protein